MIVARTTSCAVLRTTMIGSWSELCHAQIGNTKMIAVTWDAEALSELCNQTMSATNARNPIEYRWGMFSFADAPPAIGGGVGAFQWFETLQELLAFITDLSAARFTTFEEESEYIDLRDGLRKIASGYEADPKRTIDAFNQELTDLLQITWIGKFEDLASGEEGFPEVVRARFRDDWDDEPVSGSKASIRNEEKHNFINYLSEYGI